MDEVVMTAAQSLDKATHVFSGDHAEISWTALLTRLAVAAAIVAGEAKPGACTVCDADALRAIGEVMGIEVEVPVRMRAQVMCSGTKNYALPCWSLGNSRASAG